METKEMKQKNEEILKRWRQIGFLYGLKEGSINEWRCAKSFEDMAQYALNSQDCSYAIDTLSFPFIRRSLCRNKERLHRIITPEEIVEFFETKTPLECWNFFKEIYLPDNGKISNNRRESHKLIYNTFKNFLEYDGIGNKSLKEFYEEMMNGDNPICKAFATITKGNYDWEAELLSAAQMMFVHNKKREN